jgi:hypothetical protein
VDVIDATLTGQKYRDQILRSLVVPHFDGHSKLTNYDG